MSGSLSNNSSTSTCGTLFYPHPCPLTLPINGRGSDCYNQYFFVPVCSITTTYDNWDPLSGTYTAGVVDGVLGQEIKQSVSFREIDEMYVQNSTVAVMMGVSLALGITTLINVLVLTPARKRYSGIFWVLMLGCVAVIVRGVCGVQLVTGDVSGYLELTQDWASTGWSTGYRSRIIVVQVSICVGLIFLEVALFIQGKALLTWVKIKRGPATFYSMLAFLVGLAVAGWCYRVTFAAYSVRFLAFPDEGLWLPAIVNGALWKAYERWSAGLVGASLGLWCLLIMANSVSVAVARNEVLYSTESQDPRAGGAKRLKRRRIRNAYELALRTISFVSVQTFVVPSKFCLGTTKVLLKMSVQRIMLTRYRTVLLIIISYLPSTTIPLEVLIQPVIFALLPFSSLLVNVASEPDKVAEQESRSVGTTGQLSGHVGYQPYTNGLNPATVRNEVAELADLRSSPIRGNGIFDSKIQIKDVGTDRELEEIDRMG
ncbi:pheromone alpha factor receptor [Lithohypha guttulata]|uniref:pheromone alpha factor receptor n=1 Tax=Lithohypha guttulata TaxID=1690604 RepID=UPI002DDF61F9|nr:hypothetical protein LTR51_007671 [Lithohypha guttulata]